MNGFGRLAVGFWWIRCWSLGVFGHRAWEIGPPCSTPDLWCNIFGCCFRDRWRQKSCRRVAVNGVLFSLQDSFRCHNLHQHYFYMQLLLVWFGFEVLVFGPHPVRSVSGIQSAALPTALAHQMGTEGDWLQRPISGES